MLTRTREHGAQLNGYESSFMGTRIFRPFHEIQGIFVSPSSGKEPMAVTDVSDLLPTGKFPYRYIPVVREHQIDGVSGVGNGIELVSASRLAAGLISPGRMLHITPAC